MSIKYIPGETSGVVIEQVTFETEFKENDTGDGEEYRNIVRVITNVEIDNIKNMTIATGLETEWKVEGQCNGGDVIQLYLGTGWDIPWRNTVQDFIAIKERGCKLMQHRAEWMGVSDWNPVDWW